MDLWPTRSISGTRPTWARTIVLREEPDDVTMATEDNDLDSVRESFGFESIALLGHSGAVCWRWNTRSGIPNGCRTSSDEHAPASRADALILRRELARRNLRRDSAHESSDPTRDSRRVIRYRGRVLPNPYGTTLRNQEHLDRWSVGSGQPHCGRHSRRELRGSPVRGHVGPRRLRPHPFASQLDIPRSSLGRGRLHPERCDRSHADAMPSSRWWCWQTADTSRTRQPTRAARSSRVPDVCDEQLGPSDR